MKKNVIVVAMVKIRRREYSNLRLTSKLAHKATSNGYSVVVVDASTNRITKKCLVRAKAVTVSSRLRGSGGNQRYAFFSAKEIAKETDARIFVWLKPEQQSMVSSIEKIVEPIIDNRADIVMARRSEKSWSTHPEWRRDHEKRINSVYNGLMLKYVVADNFDPTFGPIAVRFEFMEFFVMADLREIARELSDGYVPYYAPVIAGVKGGARFSVVEVDYKYPRVLRKEEELRSRDLYELYSKERKDLIRGFAVIFSPHTKDLLLRFRRK